MKSSSLQIRRDSLRVEISSGVMNFIEVLPSVGWDRHSHIESLRGCCLLLEATKLFRALERVKKSSGQLHSCCRVVYVDIMQRPNLIMSFLALRLLTSHSVYPEGGFH